MFRIRFGLPRIVATGIAALALAVPSAAVAQVDVRNPDSKSAAIEAQQDSSPAPLVAGEESGFDWGDAAIGAGSVVGLLLIGLSVAFGVVHRRGRGMQGPDGPAVTT